MIHPNTEVRFVSKNIGYGVFATAPIPKGTIVYVKDLLDIEITPEDFVALDEPHKVLAEKYSYMDERGIRIISWDHAKHVNHRCDCNTISTGYGFEVAIRDIEKGEEITDEYGLFNIEREITLACHCPNCRKTLRPDDIDRYYPIWDSWVINALQHVEHVAQPLWDFMGLQTKASLMNYLAGHEEYRSVLALKWVGRERLAPAQPDGSRRAPPKASTATK